MTKISNLFDLMQKKGITAKKLSEDTGISAGNISDWKSGRSSPSIITLKKLSKYFEVPVDYLLGNDNYIFSKEELRLIQLFRNLGQKQQDELLQKLGVSP